MTQQLPEGWRSGNDINTRRLCYTNVYNNKAQWELPTKTAYQTQIQDLQNTIKQQQDEIRQVQSRDLEIRTSFAKQEREIRELRALLGKQQKEIQELQTKQALPAEALPAEALPAQALPALPSLLTKSEAKEPRQPSSYKPPQPRTCEKCSTTFPSGQALFRHLPDCQPFQCTKCESTFPSNTTLHKHVRGCRRLKEKQENQEKLPGEVEHKENQEKLPGEAEHKEN
jgi:hypothetical protein